VRGAALAFLLVASMLAGCSVIPEPQPKEVRGTVEGYDPTASHLKVHVRDGERVMLADFDRRDWNVAGIAKMIDEKRLQLLSVRGMPREVLNEVLVETVGDPSELAKFRWTSATTPEERSAADAAYDRLVAAADALDGPPAIGTPPPLLSTPALP